MSFVFRMFNFAALGAILLTPFWMFNSGIDRLLPPSPRADTTATQLRGRIAAQLGDLKRDIHADMCRRDAGAVCLLGFCAPSKGRCP